MAELSKSIKSAEEVLREVAERTRARAVERARKAAPKPKPKGKPRGGAKPDELRRMAAVRRLATLEREYEMGLRYLQRLEARPQRSLLGAEIAAAKDRLDAMEAEIHQMAAIVEAVRPGLEGNGFWDSISSFLSGLFGRKKEESKPAAAAADPVEEAKKALAPMGISSRKEFNKWALRNHPDKGGDTAQFQRVSSLADKAFKGGRRRKVVSK